MVSPAAQQASAATVPPGTPKPSGLEGTTRINPGDSVGIGWQNITSGNR